MTEIKFKWTSYARNIITKADKAKIRALVRDMLFKDYNYSNGIYDACRHYREFRSYKDLESDFYVCMIKLELGQGHLVCTIDQLPDSDYVTSENSDGCRPVREAKIPKH